MGLFDKFKKDVSDNDASIQGKNETSEEYRARILKSRNPEGEELTKQKEESNNEYFNRVKHQVSNSVIKRNDINNLKEAYKLGYVGSLDEDKARDQLDRHQRNNRKFNKKEGLWEDTHGNKYMADGSKIDD